MNAMSEANRHEDPIVDNRSTDPGTLTPAAPQAPAPLFARTDTAERDRSISAVRQWISTPSQIPSTRTVTPQGGVIDQLDVLDLDLPEDVRTKLIRAHDHGMQLPNGYRIPDSGIGWLLTWPDSTKSGDFRLARGVDGNRADAVEGAMVLAFFTLMLFCVTFLVCWQGGGDGFFYDHKWLLSGAAAGGLATLGAGKILVSEWNGLSKADTKTVRNAIAAEIESRTSESKSRTREEVIVQVARQLISELRTNTAWTSGYLDLSRATFDPTTELREITEFAAQIRAMRDDLGPKPTGTIPESSLAQQHWDANSADLDAVFTALVVRVAALHHYLGVLTDLAEKIDALASIERSLATNADIVTLAHHLGANDIATDRYDRLIADATTLRADITTLTTHLAAGEG